MIKNYETLKKQSKTVTTNQVMLELIQLVFMSVKVLLMVTMILLTRLGETCRQNILWFTPPPI